MHTSFLVASALLASLLGAQDDPPKQEPPPGSAAKSPMETMARYHPKAGTVKIGTVAEVNLGEGWAWLDGADGRRFLTDRRNQPGPDILGVALPPDFAESGVFAVYSYDDDGHVKDDEDLDNDQLLADMQASAVEGSKARKKAGLEGVRLLGWAEPPHYDKTQHKLYWAKRLQFEGNDGETLNYNVRVLGRTGHLVVNGVGAIEQLATVAACNQELLRATEFIEGKRYTDFEPEYDKIAAYGIGGLVAGKIALKVGLLAKFGVLLKGLIKPLIFVVVLIGGFFVKMFRGKKAKPEAEAGA